MFKKIFVLFLVISFFLVVSCKESEEAAMKKTQEWMKTAELGEFQPEIEDWDSIIEKAKSESTLKVYSTTGKIDDIATSFNEKYGIKIDFVEVEDEEIHDKLLSEQNSGDYSVDLVLSSNPARLKNEFVNKMKLFKYIPRDIEANLNKYAANQPLSYYRFGAKAIMYNSEKYSSSPIKTLWDLTDEKWKGNIYMKYPNSSPDEMAFMVAITKHSDELSNIYKEQYGEELVLDGTDNAGYEFLKRFFNNDIVFLTSSSKIAKAIGADMQENPPVGILGTTRLGKIKRDKLKVAVAENVKPVSGFHDKEAVLISRYAENINTAKLLVKWIYGDENGGQGFEKFNRIGEWSARTDIPLPKGQVALENTGFWMQDEDWEIENFEKVKAFLDIHM